MSTPETVMAFRMRKTGAAVDWSQLGQFLVTRLGYPAAGIMMMVGLWWIGGWLIASNPATESFADFAPEPTFYRLIELVTNGYMIEASLPSLQRIGLGLLWAVLIGVPVGVAIGLFARMRELTHVPFQFLRMISPLAWMPIAVMAFATWDSAIVFLITVAAIWPIVFSSAQGVRRIDPLWFKVAKNLGAGGVQMLWRIILPAIGQDVFAGIRLAVGVAWIVLVPAEYLGVTSGLGYAINDARDTLEYDTLAAMVVIIGIIGFFLDAICVSFIKRFSWHNQD
jgi:NitT/TauT family transport system permease protein